MAGASFPRDAANAPASSSSSTARRRSHRLSLDAPLDALAVADGAHLPAPLVWEWQQTTSSAASRSGYQTKGTRRRSLRHVDAASSSLPALESTRGCRRALQALALAPLCPPRPSSGRPFQAPLPPKAGSEARPAPPLPTRRSLRLRGQIEPGPALSSVDLHARPEWPSGTRRPLRSNTLLTDLAVNTLASASHKGNRKRPAPATTANSAAASRAATPSDDLVEATQTTSSATSPSSTVRPRIAQPTPPCSCPVTPSPSLSVRISDSGTRPASPLRPRLVAPATPPPSVPRTAPRPMSGGKRTPSASALRSPRTPGSARLCGSSSSAPSASTPTARGLQTPLSSSSLPSSRLQTPGSVSSFTSFSSPFVAGSPYLDMATARSADSSGPSTPLAKRPRLVHLSSLAGSSVEGSPNGGGGDLSRRGLEAVESAWAEEDWGF